MKINNITFEDRKHLNTYVNAIKNRYSINEILKQDNFQFLKSLLKNVYDKSFVESLKAVKVVRINRYGKNVTCFQGVTATKEYTLSGKRCVDFVF
jgi:hypothetical protein